MSNSTVTRQLALASAWALFALFAASVAADDRQPGSSPGPSLNGPAGNPSDTSDSKDNKAPSSPRPNQVPGDKDANPPMPATGENRDEKPNSTPANRPDPAPAAQPGATPPRADQPHQPAPPAANQPANAPNRQAGNQPAAAENRDRANTPANANRNQPGANQPPAQRPFANDGNAARGGAQHLSNQANIGLAFAGGANGQLLVSSIAANSYFSNIGLRSGDRIVSVGGRNFNNQAAFYSWLGAVPVGQRVPFVVMRDGQQYTLYWTPTQQFADQFQAMPANDQVNLLGIRLDDQVQDAAVVAAVDPGSPAQRAGVQPGDAVVGINGQAIATPAQFAEVAGHVSTDSAIDMAVSRTMNLQVTSAANQVQTSDVPPPVVAPAPVQHTPAVAPTYRRGLFRRR